MAEEKKEEEKKPEAKAEDAKKGEKKDAKAKAAPKEGKLKLFLASLTARERSIAMGAGIIMAFVIIDGLVVRPITQNLERIEGRIQEAEAIIPKRLMILKHEHKIVRDYKSLESYMTDPEISREEEIARLLRDIEGVSNDSGLFISNINPVEVSTEPDGRYFLTVAIEGKGQMEHIRRYVRILEKSNPAIRVGNFSFRVKKKGSDELTYALTIIKLGITVS